MSLHLALLVAMLTSALGCLCCGLTAGIAVERRRVRDQWPELAPWVTRTPQEVAADPDVVVPMPRPPEPAPKRKPKPPARTPTAGPVAGA